MLKAKEAKEATLHHISANRALRNAIADLEATLLKAVESGDFSLTLKVELKDTFVTNGITKYLIDHGYSVEVEMGKRYANISAHW